VPRPSVAPAGDRAIVVSFGEEISEELNDAVLALDGRLQSERIEGVLETQPTYRSLLVRYDPDRASFRSLARRLRRLADGGAPAGAGPARVVEIPVAYGGPYGEDLPDVVRHAGLSEEEVVARHCSRDYRIYMLGFLPGFAYLGGMDEALATPRLPTPRKAIPAGSVGIGGAQTGIYPQRSPGGWRLIGRTPLRPYDPDRDPPFLYGAGDRIRFRPVSEAEFLDLEARIEAGEA
jgi:inhibitor of KinA